MAQVTDPKPAARFHDGPARILSAVKVEPFMIKHVTEDGRESMVLVWVFGEADYGKQGRSEDRMPGVWAVANMTQLQEQLRLVPREQARQVLATLEEKGYYRDGKPVIPASAAASLPDVSSVFENLDTKPADKE